MLGSSVHIFLFVMTHGEDVGTEQRSKTWKPDTDATAQRGRNVTVTAPLSSCKYLGLTTTTHRAPERAPPLPPRSISGHGDRRAPCPAPPELFRDLARAGQKRRNTVDSRTVPAARTVGFGLRTTQAATAAGLCSLVLSPAPPNHVPTPRPTQETPPACFHDALRCPERKREKCKGSGGPCPRHHRAQAICVPTTRLETGQVQRKRSLQITDGTGPASHSGMFLSQKPRSENTVECSQLVWNGLDSPRS